MPCYGAAKTQDAKRRFWARVQKAKGEACWLWTGAKYPSGYGQFSFEGRSQLAHRVAWILRYGPIPEDKQVLHTCDVRHCVRHLYLGTQQDNMRDMYLRSRHRAKLSPEQVNFIKDNYPEPYSSREIAKMFGISTRHVPYIKNGFSWSYL